MISFLSLPKHGPEVADCLFDVPAQFRSPGSHLDIQTLRSLWVHHSEIDEFAGVAAKVPMAFARVLRSIGEIGTCAYAYRPDECPMLDEIFLITLDEDGLPPHLTLPELLLHEMAHWYSGEAAHDWNFLLALNLMRLECGYKPTEDDADCSDLLHLYPEVPASVILQRGADEAIALRDQLGNLGAMDCVPTSICPFENGS